MSLNAEKIVSAIGKGVCDALQTNEFFLGVEQFEFENADIHPEYITTVKVAEKLTDPERVVSLETHIKTLRHHAHRLAQMRRRKDWDEVKETLRPYVFGKKDSQRIDIVVRSSDPSVVPLLIVEAKLGIHNLPGILADIDRILKVLTMYSDVGILDDSFYGAVVFHIMEEGGTAERLTVRSSNLVAGITAHLANQKLTSPWLKSQVNLLSRAQILRDVSGYLEHNPDGTTERVFGKDRFAFAPGIVLLGKAADIETVRL